MAGWVKCRMGQTRFRSPMHQALPPAILITVKAKNYCKRRPVGIYLLGSDPFKDSANVPGDTGSLRADGILKLVLYVLRCVACALPPVSYLVVQGVALSALRRAVCIGDAGRSERLRPSMPHLQLSGLHSCTHAPPACLQLCAWSDNMVGRLLCCVRITVCTEPGFASDQHS